MARALTEGASERRAGRDGASDDVGNKQQTFGVADGAAARLNHRNLPDFGFNVYAISLRTDAEDTLKGR